MERFKPKMSTLAIPKDLSDLWHLLTPQEREQAEADLLALAGMKTGDLEWLPLPGPQTEAFYSEADELLYGGAAGGGKTDLLLGLAGASHYRSIIFRRVFPSMRGIIERSREIYNCRGDNHAKDSYNESLHLWRMGDGRIIEFGSMQHEKGKEDYRGRPHDLYAWDEVTEFAESQYRFVNAWNRSTRPGQRCRVVATCNPPTTTEGRWIIKYWAPWLDDKHPNPASPGELRWFATIDGKDVEVSGPDIFKHKGEPIRPKSRTFIAALLSDNPYLEGTGYRATLQGLPEPLRSQMLQGDFKASMRDDPWQVIPTAWVDAAIKRWRERMKPETPLTALGVDPTRGGQDVFAIAPRYDNYFAPIVKHLPGQLIDGPTGAKYVWDEYVQGAHINIDVIGIGSSVYDSLKSAEGVEVNPINNAESSDLRDKTGKYRLVNIRTASYWKFREALDPESGQDICLPDDDEMRADLIAPTYKVTTSGIVVEPKTGPGSISERLGRSPDFGDAIVLAHWQPPKQEFFFI